MSDLTLVGPIKLTAVGPIEQRILDYLNENASEVLAAKINAGKKTLAGALSYAKGEAKELGAVDGCVCVDDATVFGWIVHFFEEDEITEPKAEKPAPKKKSVTVPGGVKKANKAGKAGGTPAVQKPEKPQGPIFLELFKAKDVESTKPVEKS